MTDAPPLVSVVIPTWNGAELLAHALRSLRSQEWRDFEILVVDNGSVDGTVEMLAREFPEAIVVALPENRGFAGAVNAGIARARGELVVLMNNDTEAEPGWIRALVEAAREYGAAGTFASRMLDFEDRGRIDSAGDRMGLRASQIGHGEPDGAEYRVSREVFSPCAGAAAYRRSVLERIGGFDERFFAYLEDVDIGFRAQIAGYPCRYVPGAVIYHRGGATSGRLSDTRAYWLTRNTLFLFFQNMPRRVVWRHGWYMLFWPLIDAARHGRKTSIAARALGAFLMDLPAVVGRRRRAYAERRVSDEALIARLSIRAPSIGAPDARKDER